MPKMPSVLSRCIFYIYPSEDDAKNSTEKGGTGFFFGVESEYTDWGALLCCYECTRCFFATEWKIQLLELTQQIISLTL